MDTKGNGLDRTNELLGQVVQELLAIKNRLGMMDQRLDSMDHRLMGVETGITQLNTNMGHLATLVGEELRDIRKRLDTLERKAA